MVIQLTLLSRRVISHSPIIYAKHAFHSPLVIQAFLSPHRLAGMATYLVVSHLQSVSDPESLRVLNWIWRVRVTSA